MNKKFMVMSLDFDVSQCQLSDKMERQIYINISTTLAGQTKIDKNIIKIDFLNDLMIYNRSTGDNNLKMNLDWNDN